MIIKMHIGGIDKILETYNKKNKIQFLSMMSLEAAIHMFTWFFIRTYLFAGFLNSYGSSLSEKQNIGDNNYCSDKPIYEYMRKLKYIFRRIDVLHSYLKKIH